MGTSYSIQLIKVGNAVDTLDDIQKLLISSENKLENIKSNLRKGNSYSEIIDVLEWITDNANYPNKVKNLQNTLRKIVSQYSTTEEDISGRKLHMPKVKNPETVEGSDYWDNYADGFWGNFITELLSTLATSGSYKIASLINMMKAIAKGPAGANSFVILDPSVAASTSKFLSNAGKAIAGVGVALDLGSMLLNGENAGDAVVKAGAHLGIGMAVGAVVGSIIPGPGTVAGAVAGLAIGAVVTYGANTLFDYIYDDPKGFLDDVESVWDNFTNVIGNAADRIGNAACSVIGNIGTAFAG